MTEEKNISNDVREAVGRRVKLALRRKVQLEVKGDKVENRVLVSGSCSDFCSCAMLLCVCRPLQLVLEHERGPWSFRLGSVEEVDEVIAQIGNCLHRICPASSPVKLMRKLNLKPPERLTALQAVWNDQCSADLGPCGGFSHQYWCVCDSLGLPYREEVQWDVDTIYLSQDTRELNLQDFVHLENRDLVAIIAVLEYNQWFTKLSTKDYKLPTDVCDQILRVVARSSRLEELVLDNAGLKSDFAQKLSGALSHNPSCTLHTLNLSNNSLEDKGVYALSSQLAKLPMGLQNLNLSKTSMSPKGVNSLCQALCANPIIASTLTHLDLSGNSLRGDDLQVCNTMSSLVCASLCRGSLKHLAILNMSRTVFSHRKCKEIPSSFKQFFSSAQALTSVSLSGTKLPLEALKSLLLGLGCNPNLSDVSLDLSSCDLRSGGSQILEGCIAEIPNISSLDISDNSLDMDLTTLLVWLAKNRSIRHLSLGKNFNNIKSKNVAQVLDNLVHMIQEEESPLTSLSLADSKLKADLSIVLNALGSNTSLIKLDIIGILIIFSKLIFLENHVSINYTIRFMPVPIMDAAQALKANPDKTEDALLKMEQYLLRNHETRKYLQEQAYRLQQGIVTTTTQQMMDMMCVRVQDHLNSLKFSEANSIQDDMKLAENLMKDAKNSKTLLPNLYHLKSGGSRVAFVAAIQDKLESMAGEVASVMDEQLQTMLVSMVDAAEGLCPHVMKRSGLRQELLKAAAGRMTIPCSFVTNTLLEQSGVDIINKISEVKLGVASILSDRIVDEILESLSRSQHTLVSAISSVKYSDSSSSDSFTIFPFMTPKSKRKSILVRMLRPVSVAFEMEFDLDKALEEVPIHVEDPPLPSPPPQSVCIGELPQLEHKTLESCTKSRPKPKKRTKPTTGSSAPHDAEQNNMMDKLDEGLDDFFSKRVVKLSFRLPSIRSPSTPTPEASDKKRESRKSGFFNLIKSRTSRSEKSHGAPAITPPQPAHANTTNTSTTNTRKKKENPHIHRHIGVPMMGKDLLAEMKARQEKTRQDKMAEKKVGQINRSLLEICISKHKLRFFRFFSLIFCLPDDSVDSAPGSVSPKAPLPAPRLKRAPSEQDRESTSSSSAGLLSPLEGYYLCLPSNNNPVVSVEADATV
uniref:CARMIL C-terminal domain-containing protein n=1 Tax=Poecilia mexicana TaxID=48701 RepID=A0A3B3Z0E0_9TELE